MKARLQPLIQSSIATAVDGVLNVVSRMQVRDIHRNRDRADIDTYPTKRDFSHVYFLGHIVGRIPRTVVWKFVSAVRGVHSFQTFCAEQKLHKRVEH